MNLSHIITEFSFGPYIPDIVQPLDYSYEKTYERKFGFLAWTSIGNLTNPLAQHLRSSSTF